MKFLETYYRIEENDVQQINNSIKEFSVKES